MPHLGLDFLGPFHVSLDGATLTGFESNKVRALLAYLAVESRRPQGREALAALLWPDWPDRAALSNLRYALSDLRKVTGDREASPPFLLINRNTIQFNAASDFRLDVAEFLNAPLTSAAEGKEHTGRLEQLISLSKGEFLEGLSVSEAAPFDDWVRAWREQIDRRLRDLIHALAKDYLQNGRYEKAELFGRRLVDAGPWNEEAHQLLIQALARSGKRSAALAQFESCRRLLEKELQVQPSPETLALVQAIRDGSLDKVLQTQGDELPAAGAPPFKGLLYFDEQDAGLFFGRELLTAKLVGHVRDMISDDPNRDTPGYKGFLGVVGASGSGKSSLVRAGLVPAVRGGKKLADGSLPPQGCRDWQITVLTPTAHPLQTLALSLAPQEPSITAITTLMDDLRRDGRSLDLYVRRAFLSSGKKRLLLVIDQFEELFTLCKDEAERAAFIDNLLTSAASGGPLLVILVLRADFYAACGRYPRLRQALSERQEYIGPMSREELQRAIEEPARGGGWELEAGLVNLILDDVGDEPGALPLLSHALLETWERRKGHRLTLQGYAHAGGVRGAIACTADTILKRFSPEKQAIMRRIFLCLTELGESTQDSRRRASMDELLLPGGDGSLVEEVLKTLVEARLITLSTNTAEVAHEALIREWPALREWLNQNREGLRLHRHLAEAALAWERMEHDPGELYRGARLAQALEWASRNENAPELTRLEGEFLAASRHHEEHEAYEREEQRQRELEAAQKLAEAEGQRAEERAQAARRLFQEERLSYARELAAHAKSSLITQPDLSQLLALEAVEVLKQAGLDVPWDVQQAVHDVALTSRLIWRRETREGATWMAAYSPDGKRVYYEVHRIGTHKIYALDAQTGVELFSIQSGVGIGLELTSDGKYLATIAGNFACLWDALTGQKILSIPLPRQADISLYGAAIDAISPNGRFLNIGIAKDLGYLVDLEPWITAGSPAGVTLTLPMKPYDHISENTPGTTFSPDGKIFTTGTEIENSYYLWDAETVTLIRTISGHTDYPRLPSFNPHGSRLATCSFDGSVRMWEVASGRELMRLSGHTSEVLSVTYSPDGKHLASAGMDARVILWDADTGRRLMDLQPGGSAYKATFSPDGERLFVTTFSGVVTMWDINPSGRGELKNVPASRPVSRITASPDGSLVVETHADGSIRLLDTRTLIEAAHFVVTPEPNGLIVPGLSRDTACLAVEVGGRILVWNMLTRNKIFDQPAEEGWEQPYAFYPAFSADGALLATGGYSGKVNIWNLVSGKKERVLAIRPASRLKYAQFSPKGRILALGCWGHLGAGGGEVWIWDLDEPDKPPRILTTDNNSFNRLSFSPDGRRLATSGQDQLSRIWNVASGEVSLVLRGHAGAIGPISFSPDGRYLATGSDDGTVRVWDAESGVELLNYISPDRTTYYLAFFTADSRRLIARGTDGYYYLLAFQDFEDLLEIMQARTTRDWKPEERRKYLRQEPAGT